MAAEAADGHDVQTVFWPYPVHAGPLPNIPPYIFRYITQKCDIFQVEIVKCVPAIKAADLDSQLVDLTLVDRGLEGEIKVIQRFPQPVHDKFSHTAPHLGDLLTKLCNQGPVRYGPRLALHGRYCMSVLQATPSPVSPIGWSHPLGAEGPHRLVRPAGRGKRHTLLFLPAEYLYPSIARL